MLNICRLPEGFASVMIGASMSLETSYEVLEMLRDDGVQTFRAKEKATGRGLELHLFPPFGRPENKTLFEKLKALPLESRKNFLDIGSDGSTPYVVTDPLAGGRCFKSWAENLFGGASAAASSFGTGIMNASPSRDDGVQILQAGQWRTGTPIPDSLVTKPHTIPSKPMQAAPVDTGDFTRMFKAPTFLNAPEPPAPAAIPAAPSPIATAPPPSEFTGFFQAKEPAKSSSNEITQEQNPAAGEFTGLFQAAKPTPAPVQAVAAPPTPLPYVPPPAYVPQPAASEPSVGGEFTRMFQAPSAASYTSPAAPPSNPPSGASGGAEFTKYFENPLKPAPMGSPQPMIELPPPPPPTGGPRAGEFTDIFGRPSAPPQSSSGGFSFDTPPPQPPPPGPVFGANPTATGAFSAQPAWSQPQAPPSFASGPSEYTKMMNAQQMSAAPAPSLFNAPPNTAAAYQQPGAKKSNTILFIAIGAAVLLVIAIVVFLLMRGAAPTIPGAK
jgi:hypothetical protein